jgi:hypothetical protein
LLRESGQIHSGLILYAWFFCQTFLARKVCGVYSGNWNNGSFNNQGSNGNYWSSTVNNATNAYNLNFNSSNVNPANNNNKQNGNAVRCVAPLALKQPPP